MTTPRRDFLSLLGMAGLGAGSGSLHLPDAGGGGDPFVKSDKWDMTWIKRVNGKARGVFDIVSATSGGGWSRVAMWHDQALEVYGNAKEVSAVAVIRHAAITLAASDAYWEEFKPGTGGGGRGRGGPGGATPPADSAAAAAAAAAAANAPPAPPPRNPIGTPKPGVTSDSKVDTITGFIAAGGIVLACNVAFSGSIRSSVARAKNLTGDAADKAARAYLIPGVILMPSGVFALIAAQQAGCGMCGGLVPSMMGAS